MTGGRQWGTRVADAQRMELTLHSNPPVPPSPDPAMPPPPTVPEVPPPPVEDPPAPAAPDPVREPGAPAPAVL